MRLIAKRCFRIADPIYRDAIDCYDTLLRNERGDFFLHSRALGLGEKLLRLSAIAAHGWLNASPDEYGIEWQDQSEALARHQTHATSAA